MAKAKRSRPEREMSPVHPHAAAIDIGATMHVAAVGRRIATPSRCAASAPSPPTCTGWPTGSSAAA